MGEIGQVVVAGVDGAEAPVLQSHCEGSPIVGHPGHVAVEHELGGRRELESARLDVVRTEALRQRNGLFRQRSTLDEPRGEHMATGQLRIRLGELAPGRCSLQDCDCLGQPLISCLGRSAKPQLAAEER